MEDLKTYKQITFTTTKTNEIEIKSLTAICAQQINETYIQTMIQKDKTITIAKIDGEIVGFCIFTICPNFIPLFQLRNTGRIDTLDIQVAWTYIQSVGYTYEYCKVSKIQNKNQFEVCCPELEDPVTTYKFDPFTDPWKYPEKRGQDKFDDICVIDLICTDQKKHRDVHVGTQIMQHVHNQYRSTNVNIFFLKSVLNAIPFYWKLGYRFIPTNLNVYKKTSRKSIRSLSVKNVEKSPCNIKWTSFFDKYKGKKIKPIEYVSGVMLIIETIKSMLTWSIPAEYKLITSHTLSPNTITVKSCEEEILNWLDGSDGFMMMYNINN
jgi:hypothetical protein